MPTNIPEEEAETLAEIEFIDQEEEKMFDNPRDWDSPVFPLIFQVALPIPPVKEPLMYV